ncbi:hypothetical protein FRB90_003080 [Tulasnella sp. 427]|nr:hypothetical protein FRB90_003080 [Tulasnella sp. 427]
MHSPPFPCLVYSLDGHSPSDAYFALPRAVFYTSTPLVVRDLQERLEFIEREVRAVRDHTAREFAALNEKLERLLRASEPQALPLGPVAEVLSKQGGHCAAELEGLRVQVVEVVADAKCLLDDIDDVDSRASSKIFEIRESAVEYLASQDEGALSSGSTTPLALSPVELPVVPILTPDQYTAIGSPDDLRQGLAAFRQALTSPSLADSLNPNLKDSNRSEDSGRDGEPASAVTTACSCHDVLDLTQKLSQIDVFIGKVREATDQIHVFTQSVKELNLEMRELRTGMASAQSGGGHKEDDSTCLPSEDASKRCLNTGTPVLATQEEFPASRNQDESGHAPPTDPPLTTDEGNPSDSNSGISASASHIGCFAFATTPSATVETEGPDDCPRVTSNAVGSAMPRPKIAYATASYTPWYASSDLRLSAGDRIALLDQPDTPEGWLYGEITETSRGIFLTQHVREISEKDPNTEAKTGPGAITMVAKSTHSTSRNGELDLWVGESVIVLPAPSNISVPVGWMYGETARSRRGRFPAVYVRVEENDNEEADGYKGDGPSNDASTGGEIEEDGSH